MCVGGHLPDSRRQISPNSHGSFGITDIARWARCVTWGRRNGVCFFKKQKRDTRGGQSMLSDLRLFLKIPSWFEPNERHRADSAPYSEVPIGEMVGKWAPNMPRVWNRPEPGRGMVYFFSAHLEVGLTARPPTTPYVAADSSGPYPWIPSDVPTRRPAIKGGRRRNLLTDSRETRTFPSGNTCSIGCVTYWPVIYRAIGRISADSSRSLT